jgi:signal transduction histidine kinase/CheY-like chemotaxis protein
LLESESDFRDLEFDWVTADGSYITVRCGGRRLKEESESSPGVEVFAEDVTEKRIMERQLRMAGKMEAIGRLSGGIAHDFNNLLGVIIGYSQLLRRKLAPEQPQLYEFAEEIHKAGERAAALTRQLLAFSRQQILTPTIVDLNQLVSDMQKMLPRLIGEDIQVQVDLQSDLGTVKADRSQVEQVIMNLAVNARDAMPNGGRLLIETANAEFDEVYVRNHDGAKVGHYVMLSVTDAGIGMTPEVIAHIFEPFFTTKELGKGTGLGLATVYGVVKQSGGYIWVDSTPGQGSSFKIFLPRTSEIIAPAVPTQVKVPEAVHRETILLVEDAEPLRKLAQSILSQHGYKILSAEHGEAALALTAQLRDPIHLLLTDVVMPGINGRVLSERLLPKYPDMKVLYMSGYTDSFIAGHGVLEQGIALLHKPFSEEALLAKVRQVLDAPSLATTEPH